MQNSSSATLILKPNGIAQITLNRPEKHNAFDAKMISELLMHLKTTREDPECRVVLLTANGKNFSAGACLHWMQSMLDASQHQNLQDALQLSKLMHTLNTLPKPTIALVQGAAFGGALGLIACCDLVIAAENASFCLSEIKLGLIPAVISPYVLASIGLRQMRRYALTAETIDAGTALSIQLVHELVPSDKLVEVGLHKAMMLLCNAPQAMHNCKKLLQGLHNRPITEKLRQTCAERIATTRVGAEAQEGMHAFFEKRPPNWIRHKKYTQSE